MSTTSNANGGPRALVIANPSAQNGAVGKKWNQISAAITEKLGPIHHRFTRGPNDAVELCAQAIVDGYELIVALGGDGTINEVVNGFFRNNSTTAPNTTAALGVLPFGTGGDFRKSLGLTTNFFRNIDALHKSAYRQIDVGQLTYTDWAGTTQSRYFINIASFGLSGLVDKYVNEGSKALGGKLSFALATLKAMRNHHPPTVTLQLDDRPLQKVAINTVAIANGQYFGGGMKIAPTARLDDGQFEVVTLGCTSMLHTLVNGHKVYSGSHVTLPEVTVSHAKHIVASLTDPHDEVLLDVDGETPGKLPCTFSILPRALKIKHTLPTQS